MTLLEGHPPAADVHSNILKTTSVSIWTCVEALKCAIFEVDGRKRVN